jgi:hypothetical protein
MDSAANYDRQKTKFSRTRLLRNALISPFPSPSLSLRCAVLGWLGLAGRAVAASELLQ